MKILIISYYYYPMINPRSFRWINLSQEFVKNKHSVDVLSFKNFGDPKYEKISGVNVFRSSDLLSTLKKKFKKNNYSKKKSNKKYRFYNLKFIKNHVLKLFNSILNNLIWPDFAFMWYFTSNKKAIQLLNKNQYNLIITVSHPFTSHLVGLKIKKKYPNVFWIADSGDPFSFGSLSSSNNFNIYSSLNKIFENKVFLKANYLTVTTELTKDRYVDLFKNFSDKIKVIPPLYDKASANNSNDLISLNDNKIILSFFGALYKNIRNPKPLLNLLNLIVANNKLLSDKIELHFYGEQNDCIDIIEEYPLIKKNVFIHGLIKKEDAYYKMKSSDILINIGNKTTYQLPSKIIDYVSVKKPILNICSINNDSVKNYLRLFPFVFNYLPGEEIKPLINFIRSSKKIKINNNDVNYFLKNHYPEVISKKYLSLVNSD
jgi:hypothetical protein